MLQILGVFCEYFPEHMFDKSKQLQTLLLDSLAKQFKAKKPGTMLLRNGLKLFCYYSPYLL
jgi:hypothetical protein